MARQGGKHFTVAWTTTCCILLIIKARLGLVRTNKRVQWNPFYKAFHRISNKKHDLDVANLRPAIRHGRNKQTQSVSISFFLMNLLYVLNIKLKRKVRSRSVHDFWTCKENAAVQWQLPIKLKNLFGRRVCRNSPLQSSILFVSPNIMHRPRFEFRLHFDVRNILQICMET